MPEIEGIQWHSQAAMTVDIQQSSDAEQSIPAAWNVDTPPLFRATLLSAPRKRRLPWCNHGGFLRGVIKQHGGKNSMVIDRSSDWSASTPLFRIFDGVGSTTDPIKNSKKRTTTTTSTSTPVTGSRSSRELDILPIQSTKKTYCAPFRLMYS